MAGGIDWFRWHHGSVSDQKFSLIAKKAGSSVAEVIAVWACLLELASAAEDRGHPGAPDFESMDCALGIEDGRSQRIYDRMLERDVVSTETGRVTSWEKRQPKREDDTAADRKRRQREREQSLTKDESRDVTPKRVDVTQCHDRVEERREEETGANAPAARATAAGAVCLALKAAGIGAVSPHNQRLQTLLEAGAEPGEFAAFAARALEVAPGRAFEYVLGAVEGERTRAASIAGRLHHGAMPAKAPSAAELRVLQAVPGIAAPHLRQSKHFATEVVDDVAPKLLG